MMMMMNKDKSYYFTFIISFFFQPYKNNLIPKLIQFEIITSYNHLIEVIQCCKKVKQD